MGTLISLLGVWLFVSAFLWPRAPGQFHNVWLTGALAAVAGVAAIAGFARARDLGLALGLWLFVTTIFVARIPPGLFVNNVLVATGLVITSLLGRRPARA